MIITCPSCATRYQVPVEAFARDDERRVRCRGCSFEWIAVPDDSQASQAQGDPEDLGRDDRFDEPDAQFDESGREVARLEPIADEDDFASQLAEVEKFERNVAGIARQAIARDIESAAHRTDRRGSRPRGRNGAGWLALAAGVTLFIVGAHEYRDEVVAGLPATAQLYEAAGMPVNIRGMEFDNVMVTREFENGLPVLAVRGDVVNVSERMLEVPKIRLGLRDAGAAEIYHWSMAVTPEPLAPAQRARFATKLAAPPSEARDVEIRFYDVLGRRAALSR